MTTPTCRNCGERIVMVNYAFGPQWTHQAAGSAFSDGAHEFCRVTVAEPTEDSRG